MAKNESAPLSVDDYKTMIALEGSVSPQTLLAAHVAKTGGEERLQQVAMLDAVTNALEDETTLIVEAGTGTGKSLAYLFPLLNYRNRSGIIATSTKQLSEQLAHRDIPQALDTLNILQPNKTLPTVALLKGRSNYVCKKKLKDIKDLDEAEKASQNSTLNDGSTQTELEIEDGQLFGTKPKRSKRAFKKLFDWALETETGDRSEAPAVNDETWKHVSMSAADCPKAPNCAFGDTCFSENVRKKARSADIVVTSHALLAQDIKALHRNDKDDLSSGSRPLVLDGPDVDIVVDEAHDFADTLTHTMSTVVTVKDFDVLRKRFSGIADKGDKDEIKSISDGMKTVLFDVESLTRFHVGRMEIPDSAFAEKLVELMEYLTKIARIASKKSASLDPSSSRRHIAFAVADSALMLRDNVAFTLNPPTDHVQWVTRREIGNIRNLSVSFNTAPLVLKHVVESMTRDRAAVFTSATMTVDGSFDPFVRTMGFTEYQELNVGSPFNYAQQGMLYVPHPSGFPVPVGAERTEHREAVLDELVSLTTASQGRALLLFTTYRAVDEAAEYLRENGPDVTVFAQGDAPPGQLVQEFIEDETSILCATMGLWQGVDAPGSTCSLVVIDKVAFTPPDDVLSAARAEYANKNGGNGFRDVVLADAAKSLAQAAGRLIRSQNDKGVVAVLDPRLISKGYGSSLIRSMPRFHVFTDQDTVTNALNRLTSKA